MYNLSPLQLLITFTPAILILAIVAVGSVLFEITIPEMTKDISATAGANPLWGFLSNFGAFLWCSTAAICAFAGLLCLQSGGKRPFCFMLFSALLSGYLLFDDFFLFHEHLAEQHLGVDEKIVLASLGISLFTYLLYFRNDILRTRFVMLLTALGLLSFSVVVDVIFEDWLLNLGDWGFFVEDGLKWLGIAAWCSYYVHTAYQLVLGLVNQGGVQSYHTGAGSRLSGSAAV